MKNQQGLLVLPALILTLLVIGGGLLMAGIQSVGLLPLFGDPEFSLAAYEGLFTSELARSLGLSLVLASATTVLSLAIGFWAAVVILASRVGRRLLAPLAAGTIPISHLVGAAAVGLLLADSGLLARIFGAEPGTWPQLVAGPWWVATIVEFTWKESAFVALVVSAALSMRSQQFAEAASLLGASRGQRLRHLTLPFATPALIASAAIIFTFTLGSYEVPWLLGRTAPEPLPVLAYRLFTDTDLTARPAALAVSLLTVVVALGVAAVAASALARRAES